jgi:very-short-patch-repair endonuclease
LNGYTFQTLQRAQQLRRDMTEAEKLLWRHLRGGQIGGAKFRRQQPIGPYIADFVCQSSRLIVEADGSQHDENSHDGQRDAWLRAKGYQILRFWNSDILTNIDGVLTAILAALTPPHPNPSPSRGEGLSDGANLG